MRLTARTCLLGLVLLSAPASAEEPASASATAQAPASAPAVAGVTVTAPALKRVPALVESFGRPYSGDRLSRWRGPVCPYVTGFAPEQNSFIAARIVQISQAAKQLAPAKTCDPNIIVVASPNDLTLRRQIGQHPQTLLSPQSRWPVDKIQLWAFIKDDGAPAHVFYASSIVSAVGSGIPLDEGAVNGSVADAGGALSAFGAPEIANARASRLTPNADDAFNRVVVVLDGRQLDGLTGGQIAAYVSMITLAEVRLEATPRDVDTIVNLFADRTAGRTLPEDLTFWDRAYLGALYNAPAQINISFQRSVMEDRIAHAIETLKLPPPPAAAPPAH
jgi:hypothetical protein